MQFSCVGQSKWWRRRTWARRRSTPGWSCGRTSLSARPCERCLCRWRLRSWCTSLEQRKQEGGSVRWTFLWTTIPNDSREAWRLTGEQLEDARDGEPLPLFQGEELSHKHKDAQDGEYTSEHRTGLHCLEVICRGSQRKGNTFRVGVGKECVLGRGGGVYWICATHYTDGYTRKTESDRDTLSL